MFIKQLLLKIVKKSKLKTEPYKTPDKTLTELDKAT